MKICPECQQNVPEEALNCPTCGYPFPETEAQIAIKPAPQEIKDETQEDFYSVFHGAHKTLNIITNILSILIAICIAIPIIKIFRWVKSDAVQQVTDYQKVLKDTKFFLVLFSITVAVNILLTTYYLIIIAACTSSRCNLHSDASRFGFIKKHKSETLQKPLQEKRYTQLNIQNIQYAGFLTWQFVGKDLPNAKKQALLYRAIYLLIVFCSLIFLYFFLKNNVEAYLFCKLWAQKFSMEWKHGIISAAIFILSIIFSKICEKKEQGLEEEWFSLASKKYE